MLFRRRVINEKQNKSISAIIKIVYFFIVRFLFVKKRAEMLLFSEHKI